MTNEKERSRKQDILALAKCVSQARAGWEKYDLSDFSLGDVSREGNHTGVVGVIATVGREVKRYR